ncbi:MAG: hypothetical protein HXX15_15690 [Rhodopseudomonas sp.]|uniref:hypothetical protein n=1 Tax=Rhodopseudomonas sp. TaxID=1078 RepID=UPI0017A1F994|nr:hypothetical protein [Rhodopseudomonas sp.]NVN87519.1 hypothetical protein [Rhodopseudomonas sp.]
MTLATSHFADDSAASRRLLPLWIGIGVYALLLVAGNGLLNDPDTLWQVTVGQWIIDHRAVPHTDVYSFTMQGQPWISTQWLAQVAYAISYALAGWAGPVVLAAAALAATFALYARFLGARLTESATLVFAAAALALMAPHMLARPHVLAMPVMVAWVGGLVAAADRRQAPSFWLLPLIALWANLHGGFVLGVALVAPLALDAVLNAPAQARLGLLARWAAFGLAALAMACITPYGWESLLASRKILSLGAALATITEWRPADFSSIGALELCLLFGFGLVLLRGITLPPIRILLLLGLTHMALNHDRNLEVLALLAPLILAAPLSRQIGAAAPAGQAKLSGTLVAGLALLLLAGTAAFASLHPLQPRAGISPEAAVAELKQLGLQRVFNDYDFGGYLIANGVAPFIDGRTELYGEQFVVDQNNAIRLKPPEKMFQMLDDYKIEATLLRTGDAVTKLLDHVDGWRKVYADDIAVIHLRDPAAVHSAAPRIVPQAR